MPGWKLPWGVGVTSPSGSLKGLKWGVFVQKKKKANPSGLCGNREGSGTAETPPLFT